MELLILSKANYLDYIDPINNLFRICFNKDLKKSYLKWRYYDNPVSDLIVAIALAEGKLVAHYAVSPCQIVKDNMSYKVALSMTTMTHPEFQGQGLFTKLAKLVYGEMENKGYSMVFGFPNNNSHGSFISRLNWVDVYQIPNLKLDIKNSYSTICQDKSNFYEDHNFEKYNYSSFENSCKIKVKKSNKYYKWRYLDNPLNDYNNIVFEEEGKKEGNIIFKIFTNEIDILEINFSSDIVLNKLLTYLINYSKDSNITSLNTWFNIFNPNYNVYEKLGFQNKEPITYFGYKNLSIFNLSNNYKNWEIQMGDSDVY